MPDRTPCLRFGTARVEVRTAARDSALHALLQGTGCFSVRHPGSKLRKQVVDRRCCSPRNELSQREYGLGQLDEFGALAGTVSRSPESVLAENGRDTLGADIFAPLRLVAVAARSATLPVERRLILKNGSLDALEQLMALF